MSPHQEQAASEAGALGYLMIAEKWQCSSVQRFGELKTKRYTLKRSTKK